MSPNIIPIYPPPSPTYKPPKNVTMSELIPSPWGCKKCGMVARAYANEVVFCETCHKKLGDDDRVDISRGPQKDAPSPPWKRMKVE